MTNFEQFDKSFDELGITFTSDVNRTVCKQFFHSQIQLLINELKECVPEKKEEKLEEQEGEEKELLTAIFGEAKTPDYFIERRFGFNSAIEQMKNKIKEFGEIKI